MSVVVGGRLGRMLGVALLAAACGLVLLAGPAAAATITVTNNLDDTTSGNGCSLREAVANANNNALTHTDCLVAGQGGGTVDRIHFNIPGAGPHLITINSQFNLTDPVFIDGLTDIPGGACPLPTGALAIRIDGGDSVPNGLFVGASAGGSTIRGLSITQNDGDALEVGASDVTITCNYIGLAADGTGSASTTGNDIGITLGGSATNVTIGGLGPGEGNVIAFNGPGIQFAGTSGHTLQGNTIRNNSARGLSASGSNHTIERNTIRDNGGAGVLIPSPSDTGNQVTQNSIFGNGSLGIDLNNDSVVAPNDAGDGDGGPNNLQNFPVLNGATATAASTTVSGTLDSVAGGNSYRIEFFSSATCDASGNGEGEVYLGFVDVTIDAGNPTGAFTATGLDPTAPGRAITATATRNAAPLDTSEFSQCFTAVAEAAQPGPTLTVNTVADTDDGTCGVLHCTLREAITRANALPGANTINFNIPGAGPHVISVTGLSGLPAISDQVTIDGLSQGDIACPLPSGALAVQLDGTATSGTGGLFLTIGSTGSTIRGLAITNFAFAIGANDGSGQRITCNYLGVEADGDDDGTNGNGEGVGLAGTSAGVAIGGPDAGDGNMIAHNSLFGIGLSGAGGHRVQGNTIRNNGFVGVSIQGFNNTVEANTIRDNGQDGVAIFAGGGHRVTRNSIVGNGTTTAHLGIDLVGSDGVNPNDTDDPDGGANNLQNFPVLARAGTNGATTTVVGTLDSAPGAYTVEFFGNAACDVSGHGEGQTFLGSITVTIDGSNPTGAFTAAGLTNTAPGQAVTATATRNAAPLDTSEFSACRAVTPPPGVTVTEVGGTAVAEGGAGDTVSVVLNAQPTANVTVSFTTGAQLQPIADLVFTPATWNVAQTVTVTAVDDAAAEGPHNATLAVTVASPDPGYDGLAVPSVDVAIADNDIPGFTITPTGGLTTTEAGGTAQFTVRLNSVPTASVTIALASSDTTEGTIAPAQSTLTFPADATALTPQTVTVTGVQDTLSDGPVAYTIVTGAATSADPNYAGLDPADVGVTNADDDGPPGLSINDVAAAEGDAGAPTLSFTVTLTPPSTQVVTVQYATADGTAPTGATGGPACAAGIDYLTTGGTLTFGIGETSKPVAVTLCPDAVVEGDETLLVTLSNPVNSTIADGQGQGTIRNDDVGGGLGFSVSTVSVPENAGVATITVQRSGGAGPAVTGATQATGTAPAANVASGSVRPNPPASPATSGAGTVAPSALAPVTVTFATADQTAKAGQDYVPAAGTLTFGVNETTKTITIPILTDSLQEGPEAFVVTLSAPTGGATLGAQATITVVIVDTTHGAPGHPGDDSADAEQEERERETEEERRQRARTNQGNKDDDSVEGDVIETRCDQPWPAVVIANRDGEVEVRLVKEAQAACASISVGDYLEADGEKQHEGLFHADSVDIKHR